MKLCNLFDKPRIIGLIANANEGKSNLIYYILDELNKKYTFTVYTYGLRCSFQRTKEIFSINQLEQISDSVVIIDEMFSLFDLDNRKVKRQIENTIRLIFHNNNVLLLCGLGENFKKFLSAKLSALIFKKVTFADLINGSTAKNIILGYKGAESGATVINLGIDKAVVFDGLDYHKLHVPYLRKYDSKAKNVSILVRKNVQKKNVTKRGSDDNE